MGGLSDRTGRRPVLVVCLLGASLTYLLLGLTESLSVLFGAAFGLGLMAGPALGGLLSLFSLHAPAFAAAALALCNAAFGYFVLPESLSPKLRVPTPLRRLNPLAQLRRVLEMRNLRWFPLAVLFLNLSFAGLLTNFPLYSNARFGWAAPANAFFFAFVGVCAVLTQGLLIGRLQPRFGEERLLLGGLCLMVVGLGLVAVVPYGSLLYPVVGALAVGVGLAVPALTTLVSRRVSGREQGRVMGGLQAVISVTLVVGPVMAGLAFERLSAPAPYWMGALLAASALLVASIALLPGRGFARHPVIDPDVPRRPGE